MTVILVIEDEADIRQNIVEVLRLEQYTVLEAAHGAEGLALVNKHRPDLVLCDIMMPVMDGYQFLVRLREQPAISLTPLIFLTARVDRGAMRQGMVLGADDFITKPFEGDELLAAVRARLELEQRRQEEYERRLENLRGSIVYTMPHELRTPLSSILGYSELMLMDGENLKVAEALDMIGSIFSSGKRLHRTIENYLVYAQTEILHTDRERLSLLRVMRLEDPGEAIEAAAHEAAEKAARLPDLTLDIADVPALLIIKDNLHKIVYELVDNACKFSSAGKPVRVTGRVNDLDYHLAVSDQGRGMTYHLAISDEGRGMKAEDIVQIGAYMQFERKLYEQQGSGMGLIVARRLAELHQGTLEVESEPGVGTTVHVILPLG